MRNLYKLRRKENFKEQFKYLKLVFNDQAILAFLVFLGAIGFVYYDFLKNVKLPRNVMDILVAVILTLVIFLGEIPSYLKKADKSFLLPINFKMAQYFKHALLNSFYIPILTITGIFGLVIPILISYNPTLTWVELLVLLFSLFALKFSIQVIRFNKFYDFSHSSFVWLSLIGVFSVSLIYIGLFINVYYLFVPSLLLASIVFLWFKHQKFENENINWLTSINSETHRQRRLYKFYNQFAQVKEITSRIKKREYLLPLYQWLPQKPFSYLYAHRIVRVQDYFGPISMQTIILIILAAFWNNFTGLLVITIIFNYLMYLQMRPIYEQEEMNIMNKILPVPNKERKDDYRRVISVVLILVNSLIMITLLIMHSDKIKNDFIFLIIVLLEDLFLTRILLNREDKRSN